MPIYEFRCDECGAGFEGLFEVGARTATCPECGSERAARRFSPIGRPLHLVKTPGENRKQERKNAELQAGARKRLKEARRRARPPEGAA